LFDLGLEDGALVVGHGRQVIASEGRSVNGKLGFPPCTLFGGPERAGARCDRSPSRTRHGFEGNEQMKVWIDQDLCTGDGLCEEIAPDVFTLLDDGLAYVKEGATVYAEAKGNKQGAEGLANFPDSRIDAVVESAEECPGECIFIEP
jgi:ferredoxin